MTSIEHYDVRDFSVIVDNSRPDIETHDVLQRFDDALELIERHQPWRLRHMRRDLRYFLIIRYPCRGAYLPAEQACVTELTFLARTDISPAPVASSIIHEGMHARMHAMGVQPYSHDAAREERICRHAELDFGRALPPELGMAVIDRAVASLALADQEVAPSIDWTEAMRRQRAIDEARGHR